MSLPGEATRRTAREAMALRSWMVRRLLHGMADRPAPHASTAAWNIALYQERCAVLLQNSLRANPDPTISDEATSVLTHYVSGEIRRILSARAEFAMLSRIAEEAGYPIIVLKGSADIADGLDIPCMDVDVWCDAPNVEDLCSRLDAIGFSASDERPDLHESARTMPGMLNIEVHTGVVGFPRSGDVPAHRSEPIHAHRMLRRLARDDHAWTVMCQAVLKHPDRRARVRDLVILRTSLDQLDAVAVQRLERRIAEAGVHRTAFEKMIALSRGKRLAVPEAFRHYTLLLRTLRHQSDSMRARLDERILDAGITGVRGELHRLQALRAQSSHQPGALRRIRARGLHAAVAVVATVLSADLLAIAWARALAAATSTPMYLASGRWRRLLEPLPSGTHGNGDGSVSHENALRALYFLSRIPFLPWRTTCLYRSITACIFLRASHVNAVLRVGAAVRDNVEAHAWVETADGDLLYETRSGWAAFS